MNTLHGEYRTHARTPIKTDASLDIPGANLDTNTLDISSRGLALHKPSKLTLTPGQTVNVTFNRMGGKTVQARIVHVEGNHIGLHLDDTHFTDADIDSIVRTAPWQQRARVAARRWLWKNARRIAVLGVNTVLRKPLLKLYKPTFIFAVYGNARDVSAYYTERMLQWMPPNILGGFIRHRRHRGLLIGSKFLESELAEDSTKVKQYLQDLRAEFPNIQKIALVGRLPNFAIKAGIHITPPFVDGSMGTRYMIWDVARQMKNMPDYQGETSIVVLGGAGRIGNKVCEDLATLFSTVIAFDPRYDQEEKIYTPSGIILRTSKELRLSEHKLFIALTHHGDVIADLQPYLMPGALIADDTHPCISTQVRARLAEHHIHTMKIVLTHDAFSTWPRMPAWNNRDIPGCLVESLVLLEQENTRLDELEPFAAAATAMGFQGKLVAAIDD